ncbi:GTP 3',8-cyclase MoaA [Desulfovibrio sp. OttesenSCG-928-A18]|nr:GTP 3',8-cyclase MoaA [Desulfovibrio sp. OttesenSCG-928-A18]
MQEPALLDAHGRKITYMRVSLTDRCNFRCVYCMPEEGEPHIPHEEILSFEELLRVCRVAAEMGISRFKVTGGEPLCRKGAVDFIRRLKQLPGVAQTTITTNGALLAPYVDELAAIGVDGINVSLDSLSQDHYNNITRARIPLGKVLPAMARARDKGILVKINVVPLKDYNESDLPELINFALTSGYHIRFIELMPVGRGKLYEGVPQDNIREMIEESFGPLAPLGRVIGNGPAECFSVAGYSGSVGFISAVSKKFCHCCNRVRLTSLGFLKTCLHHNIGVHLKPLLRSKAGDAELVQVMLAAVRKKPLAHEFARALRTGDSGNFLMNSVGG